MKYLVAALLCTSASCIPLMPAGGGAGRAPAGTAGPAGAGPAAAPSSDPSAPPATTPAAAPAGPVSVDIHGSCDKDVKVFYGEKPGFSSGTFSSIESNSTESHSFRAGEVMWVVDDHENGVSSVTITPGTHGVDVGCSAISLR